MKKLSNLETLILYGKLQKINELSDLEVSTEGIVLTSASYIKQLFNHVMRLMTRVFDWIKNYYNKYIHSSLIDSTVYRSVKILKSPIFTDLDDNAFKRELSKSISVSMVGGSLESIVLDDTTKTSIKTTIDAVYKAIDTQDKQLLATKLSEMFKYYNWNALAYLFNEDREYRGLDEIFNEVEAFIDRSIELHNVFGSNFYSDESNTNGDLLQRDIVDNLFKGLLHEDIDTTIENISKESILSGLNDIEENFKRSVKFQKQYENKLNKLLAIARRNLENYVKENEGFDSNDERYQNLIGEINWLNMIIKACLLPYNAIMLYIRVISNLAKNIYNIDYITTSNVPTPIYHLLNTPLNNVMLKPRQPLSGSGQILPPRVSFSTSWEGCCVGSPKLTTIDNNGRITKESESISSVVTYLHEGVVTKSTRCVKPNIVKYMVGVGINSDEVCVTTNIQLKLISKVRIYFNPKVSVYDRSRYVRIEYLN